MFSKQIKSVYMNGHTPALPNSLRLSKHPPALDVNTIMRILPHRFPFLLVDRILTFEPNKRAVGCKNVTVNEPFFQGHWPNVPVMPRILVIEVMAQVGSVLVISDEAAIRKGTPTEIAYLLGIDKARFHRNVVPGDQIIVEVEMLEMSETQCLIKAVAKIEDRIAAEAELLFGIKKEAPHPAPVN
jgi:beta-hydroxyacyl-ACP dehydratase FabZ